MIDPTFAPAPRGPGPRRDHVRVRGYVSLLVRLRSPSSIVSHAVLALGLLSAVLAGCGGSGGGSSENGVASKAPGEIVAATKAAADSASSVHVSGSIVSDGSPITLDMSLVAGQGGRGQLSENGLSFELIELDGTVYISGSPAFYKHFAGSTAAQLFQGKWLKAPATSGDFAALASLTDLRKLLDAALENHHGKLTKGDTTTVAGQKVVGVNDASDGGTLYVAVTGKPYPIEIAKNGAGGGKVVFDRWNEPVTLKAPADSVDVAKLQAGH
jgi:hypothetical protein